MQDILFDFISKYISLTEDEKNALLSLDLFHSVKKGTVLLNEGQKSRESFFVGLTLKHEVSYTSQYLSSFSGQSIN